MLLRLPDVRGSCKRPLEASFLMVNAREGLHCFFNTGPKLDHCILHDSWPDSGDNRLKKVQAHQHKYRKSGIGWIVQALIGPHQLYHLWNGNLGVYYEPCRGSLLVLGGGFCRLQSRTVNLWKKETAVHSFCHKWFIKTHSWSRGPIKLPAVTWGLELPIGWE